MDWPAASARRLRRTGLAEPLEDATPADVAAAMCGAHAQLIAAAEVSIALRLQRATRRDVQRALWEEHSLVKTFGPRGTVHLLPARGLAAWLGALGSCWEPPGAYRDVAFTAEETRELVTAIGEVLHDQELTGDELDEAVVAHVGRWAREPLVPGFQQDMPRWRLAVYPAAHRGVLCYGPNRGRNSTYTNPEVRPLAEREATGQVLRSYLTAYGPSTPAWFARWIGAGAAWARRAFEAADLDEVDLDGEPAWVVQGDTDAPQERPRGLRLLPYFDAYAIAGQPRERLFPGRARDRALAGSQAGNYPVLLLDGEVGGVWHQRLQGRRVAVTVEPLDDLSTRHRKALDTEVQRLGAVLDATPTLTIGTITTGPHA